MNAMQELTQRENKAVKAEWSKGARKTMHRRIRGAVKGIDDALDVIMEVRAAYGVTLEEMQAPDQTQPLTTIRQECMAEIYRSTDMSISAIGRLFNRDHSTVHHAIKVSESRA